MDKESIINLIDTLKKGEVVEFEQIPDIDMYMDQLTTFIEDRLKGYKRSKNDKILTKTMINNYTKDGILPPPEKKKYTREQVALLILIYHLKSGIMISDISSIFDVIEEKEICVSGFYKSFTEIQKKELAGFAGEIKEKLDNDEKLSSDSEYVLLLIISLIMEANSRRLLAERLIDKLTFGTEK